MFGTIESCEDWIEFILEISDQTHNAQCAIKYIFARYNSRVFKKSSSESTTWLRFFLSIFRSRSRARGSGPACEWKLTRIQNAILMHQLSVDHIITLTLLFFDKLNMYLTKNNEISSKSGTEYFRCLASHAVLRTPAVQKIYGRRFS